MKSEEACQQYIDSRIKPELQEYHHISVQGMRAGWNASAAWMKAQSPGAVMMFEERMRQIHVEGYNAEHDEQHTTIELIGAAICYAVPSQWRLSKEWVEKYWPFDAADFKPSPQDRGRELKKAGALLIAALDRLLNKTPAPGNRCSVCGLSEKAFGFVLEMVDGRLLCGPCSPSAQPEVNLLPPAPFAVSDGIIAQCVALMKQERKASISFFQRQLGIGYLQGRAVTDELERRGYIAGSTLNSGTLPREIHFDKLP